MAVSVLTCRCFLSTTVVPFAGEKKLKTSHLVSVDRHELMAPSDLALECPSLLSSSVLLSALDEPDLALAIVDSDLQFVSATNYFFDLLKLSKPCAPGDRFDRVLGGSHLDENAIRRVLDSIHSVQKDGNAKQVVLGRESREPAFQVCVRQLEDGYLAASFRKSSSQELLESAYQDPLTGAPNRLYFEHVAERALSRDLDAPVALMLVDLDRFKAVNDTLGHAAGDALLRRAAERLKSAVRSSDVVARFGGDEFAILIDPVPSKEIPTGIGQRILDLVQRTYMIEGQLVNVGVSVGIALAPRDGTDCKTLLRNADLALYQAKASGRASYQFFDPSMEERAFQRRTNELELRKALALRQLELHYQPQVDAPDGRLVGFEALIRWRHPLKGLIPPAQFMPLAEEIGVIVPIGEWVLRTACRQALQWPSEVTVAVNASPLQFDAGNFAETVRQALKATGLPGERLEIEITEGILLRNDEDVLKTLYELRSMNVRIAMDDFGTGYASLSQLARFPFDKIKIDRSLAGFEGDDLKQRAIVRAITALGQSLGICTLAEGVETADQLARLQSDGCQSVQGYLMGKPVPPDQLSAIIARLHSPTQENKT